MEGSSAPKTSTFQPRQKKGVSGIWDQPGSGTVEIEEKDWVAPLLDPSVKNTTVPL
jgi:hypothetical protein